VFFWVFWVGFFGVVFIANPVPRGDTELAANWVVLDLTYGIPLFDADLNRAVMQRIVGRGLVKAASLERLSAASLDTGAALLDFIW
jgi:hypothetical protein